MDERELADLLRDHASRHTVPGAAIGILQDGEAMTAVHGVADVTTGEPVSPETRFSVGSLTKSMVATVIARLAGAGRLSLDDPVAAHVPEVQGSGWAERATLGDLLGNRSGLPLRSNLEFDFDGRPEEDDTALSHLAQDAASAGQGPEIWSYTNLGWCLLGRAIETATGLTWERAIRRHLFDVERLGATTFASDAHLVPRASGHEITPEGVVPVEPTRSRAYGPAGTTVLSTAGDLLRFAALHLEDPRLARLRSVAAEVVISGWFDAWCLGWARFDWEGGPVWGWDGLIGGERSILRLMPEHQAAVVLLTNGSTGRAMYRSLFVDLMGARFAVGVPPLRLEPTSGAADDLARFAGSYAWPDRQIAVTATRDSLRLEEDGVQTEALPLDERTFLVKATDPDAPTVTFGAFDGAGRPGVLYDMLWGLPRLDA